jgi:hypothetical protein
MELTVVIAMEVQPPEDPGRVPVFLRNRMVVGHVVSVRSAYILDEQVHTEVVVNVRDDVVQSAIRAHMETQKPVLHIHFPRKIEDIEMMFRVRN